MRLRTFLIPGSYFINGVAIGIDIEPGFLEACKKKLADQHIHNVELLLTDISEEKQSIDGLTGKADYVSLFNILHCESPKVLLNTTHGLLKEGGTLGVIHWKRELTPRGPSMEIRPDQDAIITWALDAGFSWKREVDLLPYQYLLFEISEFQVK